MTAAPTPVDLFPQLVSLSQQDLVARRNALIGNATSIGQLDDRTLEELSAIMTLLRRGSSGPPRKEKKSKGPAPTSSLLLD